MKTKKIESLWSHLFWLGVLAETGSYTAAAGRLGVSKAAMSHRVSELEQAAGVPLVRRTTRSVRLTDAGQALVESTRAPFAEIERNFADLKDKGGGPRGLLRVTVPVALGRQRLVPLLPDFLKLYPDVRVELELSDRLSSLAKEGFDLAVRHVAVVPDTHVTWKLCDTRSVLVASRSYLKRRGVPVRPEDITGHDCLHYLREGVSPAWGFEPRKGKGSRVLVKISGLLAANNSEVLREAALAGLGITLVPDFSVQHEINDGRLVAVLPDWRPVGGFGEHLYAIRPNTLQVPLVVRTFVKYLRERLQGGFQ